MTKGSRRHKNEMLRFYRHEFGAGIQYAAGGIEVEIDDVRDIVDFQANIEQSTGNEGYTVTKESITGNVIKFKILEAVFAAGAAAWAELGNLTPIDTWILNVTYSGYQ